MVMQIFIRSPSGISALLVNYNATVKVVKQQLQCIAGFPPEEDQRLIFGGRQLPDDSTLAQNGITASSTVLMIFSSESNANLQSPSALSCGVCFETYTEDGFRSPHVLPCGHTLCRTCISHLSPRVCPFDRVTLPPENEFPRNYSIINMLQASSQRKTSVPVDEICSPGEIRIFVKTLSGSLIQLVMKSLDTIEDIKRRIESKHGVPVDQQRIIYCGKQLQNNRSLADYCIKDLSTMHLILRMRGGQNSCPTTTSSRALPGISKGEYRFLFR